jgi:putative hydrolase of the HAD superfamily
VNSLIKAVIFDFGNVIYNFDNNIFLENISKYTDKTPSELNELLYLSSDLPRQYETGLVSSDQFFNEIVSLCNLSIPKSEFIKSYTDIFSPIHSTIDLIKELSDRYRIGLLSNTSEWDFMHVIETCEVYDMFDAVSLSFKVKAMKPDKKIYLDILGKLNARPEECVYIDDMDKYIVAAHQIGIQGIQYISHDTLLHSLKKLHIV